MLTQCAGEALQQHMYVVLTLQGPRCPQGGMPHTDLVGRAEFCFGSQRSGAGAADFPLRLLSLQKHSALHMHPGAGVTLTYAGVQARRLLEPHLRF